MDIPVNSDLATKIDFLKRHNQHHEILVFQTPSECRELSPGSFELRIPYYRGQRATQVFHYKPNGEQLAEPFIFNTVI